MQKLYREVTEPERGKISDIMLILFAVVAILFFEPVLVLAGFSPALKITVQSIFCLLLILFCIYFYRRRLRSFRYTYVTDREDVFGELEDLPESYSKLPAGTLIAESIVGSGAGTVVAVIEPAEIVGLFSFEEPMPNEGRAVRINASLVPSKSASRLVYRQDGRMHVLYITPSRELAQIIKESKDTKSND